MDSPFLDEYKIQSYRANILRLPFVSLTSLNAKFFILEAEFSNGSDNSVWTLLAVRPLVTVAQCESGWINEIAECTLPLHMKP